MAFQSHAGSIEARSRGFVSTPGKSSFNPTLVRLRHRFGEKATVRMTSFNPTLVRSRPRRCGTHN